jgi:hypothetical protein
MDKPTWWGKPLLRPEPLSRLLKPFLWFSIAGLLVGMGTYFVVEPERAFAAAAAAAYAVVAIPSFLIAFFMFFFFFFRLGLALFHLTFAAWRQNLVWNPVVFWRNVFRSEAGRASVPLIVDGAAGWIFCFVVLGAMSALWTALMQYANRT